MPSTFVVCATALGGPRKGSLAFRDADDARNVELETRTPEMSLLRFHTSIPLVSVLDGFSEGGGCENYLVSSFVSVRFQLSFYREETRNEGC
jgi:hypothetical protein